MSIVLQLAQKNINSASNYIAPSGQFPVNNLSQLISKHLTSFLLVALASKTDVQTAMEIHKGVPPYII